MKNFYVRETKGYTKHPILMDTEPTITEIYLARRVREKRERQFDRAWLNPGDRNTAEYLDSIKEEIHIRSRALAYQIFEIGKLLVDAKDLLPHGSFEKWIEENFQFSERTALNFRRVYRVCLGQPELVEFFKPSILYHLCAPGFPENLREAIFDNVDGVYDLSQKELLEVAIKFNKKEIKVDSPEVQNLLKKQKDQKYYERLKILLSGLRRVLKDNREKFMSVVGRNMANPFINEKHPLEGREGSFMEKLVDHDLEMAEGGDNRYGSQISAMIGSWIEEIDVLVDELNPINNRKNCGNETVTFLEDHKEIEARRSEKLRRRTRQDVEALRSRKNQTRAKPDPEEEIGKVKRFRRSL